MTVRSTFIVGFPGETNADFEFLLDWLDEAELDRVGCFKYEPVEGAAANALAGAVPDAIKEERWHRLMAAQQKISARRLQKKIGQTIEVLVDTLETKHAIGRSKADAPEIDGHVKILGGKNLRVGEIVKVKVTSADAYDLAGKAIG
jgi:ribosomal protein S12 methylthiotransferase